MQRFNSLQEIQNQCPPEILSFMAADVDDWKNTPSLITDFEEDFGGSVYVADSVDDSIVGTHISTKVKSWRNCQTI